MGPSVDSETHWGSGDSEDGINDGDDNDNYDNDEMYADGDADYDAYLLRVQPYRAIFDPVPLDEEVQVTLTLSHGYEENMEIRGAEFSNDLFSIIEAPSTIPSEESVPLILSYRAEEARQINAVLELEFEYDGEINTVMIPLVGNPNCYSHSPEQVIFDKSTIGSKERRTLYFENCSEVAVYSVEAAIYPSRNAADSTFVLLDPPAFPYHLEAGTTLELTVEYTRRNSNFSDAKVRFSIEDFYIRRDVDLVADGDLPNFPTDDNDFETDRDDDTD